MSPRGTAPTQTFLRRMQQRVLVPMALAWLLGGAVAVAISYASTTQALDRSLLDDAFTLAGLVQLQEGRLVLPEKHDPGEFARPGRRNPSSFAMWQGDRLVAGDRDLVPAAAAPPAQAAPGRRARGWIVDDDWLRGTPVRRVSLHLAQPQPFVVVFARNDKERAEWLKRLVAYSITPQVVLLLVLGWWLGRALNEEIAPLVDLQRELESRGTNELQPMVLPSHSLELAALAQAVNGMMARIERSVQAQREFAGDVAHELRTPLAGIRSLAEHGLSSEQPAFWRGQLEQIVLGCDRTARLIEQLLDLALAAEARETLQLEPLRLDELVRGTVLSMLPRADAMGADLGVDGIDEPLTVLAHPHLLEGVLRNLIDNALRHGRPATSGVGALVTVEVQPRPAGVRLRVIDNGPGIDFERAERLLHRWEQGEGRVRRRDGAGLGLAIVVGYCRLMHIPLHMIATPGGGLTVQIDLAASAL